MRRFFRRLIEWPSSLSGRILAVLALGVLLAQLISAGIWLTQWQADAESRVRQVSKHMAFRVASTIRFFTSLPTAYRHIVLDQLRDMGGTRFFVTLNREFIQVNDLPDTKLKLAVIDEYHQALQQQLGIDPSEVHIAFSWPDDLHVLNNQTLLLDLPERWADLSLLTGPVESPILVLQIAINDKEWLYLATLMPDADFLENHAPLSKERLISLLSSLAVVLFFGVFIVRMLVRPLRRLAKAVERFGHGEACRLEETGPQEVVSAAKAFNAMQQRIQRYLDDRERLFASISHDLKTPITRLRLRAEMLDDEAHRDAFTRDLEDLDLMVKGALQSVRETDIHENQVEVDIWRMLSHMKEGAGIAHMEVKLTGKQVYPYRGKPLALKRCIGNLLDNALYYGKRAHVHVTDTEQRLCIHIRDEGPGIPPDKLDRVFTPYTRLTTDHAGHPGMGLGLSISRNIVRAHGGDIRLTNHPEGGLEVELLLPREQAQSE